MKLLKTSDELISHMKTKGILFNIVKEDDAKNECIKTAYVFVKKVVDYMDGLCQNVLTIKKYCFCREWAFARSQFFANITNGIKTPQRYPRWGILYHLYKKHFLL